MATLPVRTATELDAMRAAGGVVAQALASVRAAAVPGVRLRELDELARTTLREAGAVSSFLGYRPSWAPTPFPGVLCLSVNEVVVHGRPTGRRLLSGDLLSIDCGAIVDGWNGDAAITVRVGLDPDHVGHGAGHGAGRDDLLDPDADSGPDDARLVRATEQALQAGIAAAVPGATLLDVATAVDAVARACGFAHLPDHGGHGIGRAMHEPPFVPNQPSADAARHRLRAGNTLAIEPMLHTGTAGSGYRTKRDGWSIVTTDGKRAAHVEHTVAVTDAGPEVLTAAAPTTR